MAQDSTRWSDEALLAWVKGRSSGMSSAKIAAMCGAREEYVRVATNRVLRDDMKHSGPHVANYYWNRIGGRRK
jgi:hypothetical protein